MFVVDVCTLVLPSALRTSAGSPDCGSVMAVNESQVRCAYWRSGSLPPWAEAVATGTKTSTAATAATCTKRMLPPLEGLPVNAAYPLGSDANRNGLTPLPSGEGPRAAAHRP